MQEFDSGTRYAWYATSAYPGAFSKGKGIYDLIDAPPLVVSERPRVVFNLAGDQEICEVRRLVKEVGIQDNVQIPGWVRGAEKLDAFRWAHLLAGSPNSSGTG